MDKDFEEEKRIAEKQKQTNKNERKKNKKKENVDTKLQHKRKNLKGL